MTATPHNGKEAGLPALPRPARRRPLRGPLPRRGPRGRRLGPDAAHGQGAAAEVRRQAAVSGADRLHRAVPLTILQRRLASSPEAIHQSLRRRRERLESRRRELEVLQRGGQPSPVIAFTAPELDADDVEDLDDAPEQEVEDAEARILDQATAARSIVELKAELDTLKVLESLALGVRRRSADTKWRELASLLGEIFTATGRDGRPDRGAGDSRRRRRDPAAGGLSASEAGAWGAMEPKVR